MRCLMYIFHAFKLYIGCLSENEFMVFWPKFFFFGGNFDFNPGERIDFLFNLQMQYIKSYLKMCSECQDKNM